MLVLATFVTLAGCDADFFSEKLRPHEADALARGFIALINHGDLDGAEKLLEPRLVTLEGRGWLEVVRSHLDQGEIQSVDLTEFHIVHLINTRETRTNLIYELQFPDRWILAVVQVVERASERKVAAFQVTPETRSLRETNAFTLSRRPIGSYIVLGLAMGMPLLHLYTLFVCARTKPWRPMRPWRHKWAWILFLLIGITSLRLNWTSGQAQYYPLTFELLGASASRSGSRGPWILSVSLPLGPLLFLYERRRQALQDHPVGSGLNRS